MSRELYTPTMSLVLEVVADEFAVSRRELVSEMRARSIAWPRQVAMWLGKQVTGQSLPRIGRAIGGRDHTTVMWGCRRVEERMAEDREFAIRVEGLRVALENPASIWPRVIENPERAAA